MFVGTMNRWTDGSLLTIGPFVVRVLLMFFLYRFFKSENSNLLGYLKVSQVLFSS